MLTIRQLLRSTFPVAKRNSAWVEFVNLRRGKNRAGQPKYLTNAYTNARAPGQKNKPPARHQCSVVALDKKKGWNGYVLVSCSCEYFTYTCEYALHAHGAANIVYSNGEPPEDKNPRLTPSLCKHLYALLSGIQSGQY